jgi:GNAT superfamily N-acetyltransferase
METETVVSIANIGDREVVLSLILGQFAEHSIVVERQELMKSIEAVLGTKDLGFFLLARQGDEYVGVAYASFTWALEHCGRSAWLEELYVVPRWRSRGVGRALLMSVASEAREHRCAAIDLEVDRGHARAQNLYLREGFKRLPRSRWVRVLDEGKE